MNNQQLIIGVAVLLIVLGGYMQSREPRGIRNNNPGNIENNGINWNGLSSQQTDSRFYQFESPEYGIRAMARILNNYQTLYGISTIRGLVDRWAPPNENDTESYITHVAKAAGVGPDQVIDVAQHLDKIIPVMIKHENGKQPYSMAQIETGISMAFA